MTKPLSDERLGEIRELLQDVPDDFGDYARAIDDLLGEVDRLRAALQRSTAACAVLWREFPESDMRTYLEPETLGALTQAREALEGK